MPPQQLALSPSHIFPQELPRRFSPPPTLCSRSGSLRWVTAHGHLHRFRVWLRNITTAPTSPLPPSPREAALSHQRIIAPGHVRRRTAPAVLRRPLRQTHSHGVQLHIPRCLHRVGLVERTPNVRREKTQIVPATDVPASPRGSSPAACSAGALHSAHAIARMAVARPEYSPMARARLSSDSGTAMRCTWFGIRQ